MGAGIGQRRDVARPLRKRIAAADSRERHRSHGTRIGLLFRISSRFDFRLVQHLGHFSPAGEVNEGATSAISTVINR